MPPGVNVNPQHWQTGFWQLNPAYNNSQGMPPPPPNQAPWAAGPAWQAGPSHNPYKRVPRPPSAEYLASRLSDNPLGLTNMIPREQLYGTSGEGDDDPERGEDTPHTPWIWNPRGLVENTSDQGIITADYRDSLGRRFAQESRGPTPSRKASFDRSNDPSASGQSQTHLREPPQFRQASDPSHLNPQHHRRDLIPARHTSEPPPDRRGSVDHASTSSSPSSQISRDVLPPLDRPLDRPKDPSSMYYQRRHPEGAPSPTSQGVSRPSNSSDRPNPEARQEVTFTAKRELQPTFSTNIVRTPGHYQSPSPSRSSTSNSASSQSTPSHGSTDSQLAARMERVILSNASNPVPLTRQSSLPTQPSPSSSSSSMTGVSSFVDEPSSMLSPLMLGATPKPGTRSVSRHYSVPVIGGSSLSAIPETSPSPASLSSLRPSSRHTSPAATSHERHVTPPSHLSNPLPAPPAEIRHSNPSPQQKSPPKNYRERFRKGFWNRRGDHLTLGGFIVYAPPSKANPDELRNYPTENEGFRDHLGTFSELRSWPELPESLPRHGQPPVRPYESFIVYEYVL
jgi:hypothetical protein